MQQRFGRCQSREESFVVCRGDGKPMDLMAKVGIVVLLWFRRIVKSSEGRSICCVAFVLPPTIRGPVARPGQGLDVPAMGSL